jgi:transcriptional regulator with XRE-family HTH domain
MFREYLNTLKIKGNFTYAEISKLSGYPEATIRKILSGDTADPRFETVVKLAASMGGSIADIAGGKKASEMEANAVITLKDAYESRIAELKQDKKMLTVAVIVLGIVIVGILIFDIIIGTHGWVQY